MNQHFEEHFETREDWEAEYDAYCDEQDWRNDAFFDEGKY